jgi:hypothetical protein
MGMSGSSHPQVRNSKFEWLCAALILLCALMIGAEAHYQVMLG